MRRADAWAALLLASATIAGGAWAQPYDDETDDEDDKPAEPAKPAAPASKAEPEPKAEVADDADKEDEEEEEEGTFGIAGLDIKWGVHLQSDLRFRVEDKGVGNWYDRRELPKGVDRNQNQIGLRVDATYGRVAAHIDLDFVIYGYSREVDSLDDLSFGEEVSPFRFDAHKAYIQVKDLFVDGFDLSIGQMTELWGMGDQFNPTNNLSADTVEDVLRFGDQQGNFMVKLDYWIDEDWALTGVLVPIFKPALLPPSAQLALARVDRLPLNDEFLRWRIESEQAAAAGNLIGYPTIVKSASIELPDKSFENMQVGYRIAGTIAGQDVALSYYNGRTDFPVAKHNHTRQNAGERCNPDDASQCIKGLLETEVTLHYPRMHVYGFNMAGEIGWLKAAAEDVFNSIGYRIEAALIVPERVDLEITNDALDLGLTNVAAGPYDFEGRPSTVVDSTPFGKWSFGLDYTFNKYLYANVQWVHGFPDEYGAGDVFTNSFRDAAADKRYAVRESGVTSDETTTALSCALPRDGTKCAREVLKPKLGDYLVLGFDTRLLDQALLLRIFTIFDLTGVDFTVFDPATGVRVTEHHTMFTEEGFSAVIYPEIDYNFKNGLELGIGALWQIGKDYSKFGDPATGGSLVWTRARFSF
jgi:hypothetical protein